MRRFAELFFELDTTTRTNDKVAAMARYFEHAPPADAAWAVQVLCGGTVIRAFPTKHLRQWMSEETGLPLWLIAASYDAVGDLSETLARLLPDREPTDQPLHEVIEQRVQPLPQMDDATRRQTVVESWHMMSQLQRFLYHKFITGALRVGVSQKLVVRALAEVAGIDQAVMAHRLAGQWQPTAADYQALFAPVSASHDPGQPYPFFLAHPIEMASESLGPIEDWLVEWKWDGVRAQLLRRQGPVMVWTRGDELVSPAFPEVMQAGQHLPEGTVLDGEIVAWEQGQPLPFAMLQRRLNRKSMAPMLFPEVPVVFMAFDLLEHQGIDIRHQTTAERRARLEALIEADLPTETPLRLSPRVAVDDWDALQAMLDDAARRGVEGVMLKRWDAMYHVGRPRGPWWKWKLPPHTVDAVLIHAQHGSGKRAGLFTDYTFGVWHEGQLVPVAKAYSGLTNDEIREVDRFIRNHTLARHGPVHAVEPRLVFELGFENIQRSSRHKAGLALRFPRMLRQRSDKTPAEADTLATLQALLAEVQPSRH
jgi:DNA ligase-1